MNIGKPQRVIVVQPEPVRAPASPEPEPSPAVEPIREPVVEPQKVGAPA
jgi:hypothetical protein